MRRFTGKWKALFSISVTILLVFYIEILSYIINTQNWLKFATNGQNSVRGDKDNKDGPLRVLLVADPQILGENNEIPFFGLFTRWDGDRYLQRNFLLAQYHTQPHVVIFLGDLFDEGSRATDSEYRRYTQRFKDIFQLPRKQDPSPIEYIFLPGDNDIGGEGVEPVDAIKVKWFNQTFGDFRKELVLQKGPVRAQFIKMNLLLPEEYQNPVQGREHLLLQQNEDPRILLSHTSLLEFKTNAVHTILDKFHPQVIFSAHSHHSTYTQIVGSEVAKMTKQFLMAHKHPSKQWTLKSMKIPGFNKNNQKDVDETNPESLRLQTSSTITLQLPADKINKIIHEISVPTCSYRMGVPHTGFGAFNLYKNGTLEYTVLWLPSRLNQLYAYLIIYLMMKFSIISWVVFKAVCFVCQKFKSFITLNNNNSIKSIKGSYHKV